MGGGFGNVTNNTMLTNCRSLASLVEGIRSGTSEAARVGGLIGTMYHGELINCYARAEVSASGAISVYSGGLMGILEPVSSASAVIISECYASGNVSAVCSGSEKTAAGGLIGHIYRGDPGSISLLNNYAVGNVSADCSGTGVTGSAYAGGLVGLVRDAITANPSNPSPYKQFTIQYCVAAGTVSAKCNSSSTTTGVYSYSGGIVGFMNVYLANNSGTLKNNAAVGTSVTAISAVTGRTIVGRIYGDIGGQVTTPALNYGRNNMFLGTATPYSAPPVALPSRPVNNATGSDGANAGNTDFVSTSFWLNPVGLDFNTISSPAISGIWSFTGLEGRGYPILVKLGGQQ
jgi:hypothetical protein